jgi:hypothetical protein
MRMPVTIPLLRRLATCAGLAFLCLAACRSSPKYPEPPPGSYAAESMSVELAGSQKTISGAKVARPFFQTAGVAPLLGRVFLMVDDDSATAVVVLSEKLWRDSFGRDPSVIGRQITVSGRPSTIVGVMPPSFDSPPGTLLWVPRNELVAK